MRKKCQIRSKRDAGRRRAKELRRLALAKRYGLRPTRRPRYQTKPGWEPTWWHSR